MDPRQQHPFSRNTASPYARSPFPPASNQPPFPPSSHPPNATPSYAEHQRRPSDPPYGHQQRNYAQEGPGMPGPTHSRHQSASSIGGFGATGSRGMPPPSSPQQQTQHGYGQPPRAPPPPLSTGANAFSSGRELPSLNLLGRAPSAAGGSMSISAMLGGPPPAAREQPSQYTSPVTTSASQYPSAAHASPRTTTAGSDYAPFRRPQTPEHQRAYEARDHRANSAGSPPGGGPFGTPGASRYGTPHTYGQRPPVDERRDQPPIRVANPNVPPRPSSQPSSYNQQPPRAPDRAPANTEGPFGRREPPRPDPLGRPDPAYQRQAEYEERYAYEQRARQDREREAMFQREQREQREREQQREQAAERERERERVRNSSLQQGYAHDLAQRTPQNAYNRPAEAPREQPPWMRPGYEPPRPAYEPIPEQEHREPSRQPSNGHGFPATTGTQYGSHPAYAPPESRYAPSQASPMPPRQHIPAPVSQYEVSIQERQDRERQRLQAAEQQQRQHSLYGQPPQGGPFQTQESPTRRAVEESQQMQQQRSFLGVQEINRKGRVSPLPQAVQGAQGQLVGPAHEPGIKSEFGRMFGGIGSGVGSMGVPSPVTAGTQGMPFSNPGQMRRDEGDQDSPIENGRNNPTTASRGGRRRKLKDEDIRGDDEGSTGRNTPSGRGKRAKTHHHHHHNHHHHHHHSTNPLDITSSPSQNPFNSVKGTAIPSPPGIESKGAPGLHHHHVPRHHHHHVTPSKPAPVTNPVIPLPKMTINSKAVLDSVAHLPRKHLGHEYYKSILKPAKRSSMEKDERGFASTPIPLPRFEGQENSTFTIKIPRVYVDEMSREEITSRRAVYGTDVYTDDSDVIAACIHQGWFRGAWKKNIDVDLLGLEKDAPTSGAVNGKDYENDVLFDPPSRGPMHVPQKKDLHVTVLVLPALEKYSSTTRYGLKSREWGGRHDGYKGSHDGLSFMVMSIQWVEGVNGNEGREVARRKIMAEEMNSTELSGGASWPNLLVNGNEKGGDDEEISVEESFERGADVMVGVETNGDLKGVGTNSWWKEPNGSSKGKAKENVLDLNPGVQNAKDKEIESVAERMIENANAAAENVNAIIVHGAAANVPMVADTVQPGKAVDEIMAVA